MTKQRKIYAAAYYPRGEQNQARLERIRAAAIEALAEAVNNYYKLNNKDQRFIPDQVIAGQMKQYNKYRIRQFFFYDVPLYPKKQIK